MKRALKSNDILETPVWVYGKLGLFDLDPCAGPSTNIAKVNWCIDRGECGLTNEWFGFVWCNPPFSQKQDWINKFLNHGNGILLLPERGSAPWFGPLATEVGQYFVMGRKINFVKGSSSNNVGSILFPLGDEAIHRIHDSGLPGHFNVVKYFKPRLI